MVTYYITYYSSWFCYIVSLYSLKILYIHPLTISTYVLWVTSVLYHRNGYENHGLYIQKIDKGMVKITTFLYAFYFYSYYQLWLAILYMMFCYYVIMPKYIDNVYLCSRIHFSFHLVTSLTMLYLINSLTRVELSPLVALL